MTILSQRKSLFVFSFFRFFLQISRVGLLHYESREIVNYCLNPCINLSIVQSREIVNYCLNPSIILSIRSTKTD